MEIECVQLSTLVRHVQQDWCRAGWQVGFGFSRLRFWLSSGSLAGVEAFSAQLFEWRGPAPFYWLAVPEQECDQVRAAAGGATYGWGVVPVEVRIGGTTWETSLLPREGGYLLPVRKDVRRRERFDDGDTVVVTMRVSPRGGRAANGTGPAT